MLVARRCGGILFPGGGPPRLAPSTVRGLEPLLGLRRKWHDHDATRDEQLADRITTDTLVRRRHPGAELVRGQIARAVDEDRELVGRTGPPPRRRAAPVGTQMLDLTQQVVV